MNFLNGLNDKVSSRPVFFFSTLAVLCVVIALYIYSKRSEASARAARDVNTRDVNTRAAAAKERERERERESGPREIVDGHDVVGFGSGGGGDDSDEMIDDRVEHYASEGGYGGSEGGLEDDHEILESDEDVDTYE